MDQRLLEIVKALAAIDPIDPLEPPSHCVLCGGAFTIMGDYHPHQNNCPWQMANTWVIEHEAQKFEYETVIRKVLGPITIESTAPLSYLDRKHVERCVLVHGITEARTVEGNKVINWRVKER